MHFEADAGIPRAEWDEFCVAHELVHAPSEPAGNVWYCGGKRGVQCIYGNGKLADSASEVMFITPWGGPKMVPLAVLARDFWVRFGGALYAETDLRPLIVGGEASAL